MDILLIHTPVPQIEVDNLDPPMGLLYLGASIEKSGYTVEILDLSSFSENKCYDLLEKKCLNFEFVGFSTYTGNYNFTLKLLSFVKKCNSALITIAGGPHATALPDEVAEKFDYVICGEGEESILHVLNRKAPKRIIYSNPIKDLDELPLPAYHLVDLYNYTRIVDGNKAIAILSTRGCPYQCVFCNSIIFSKKHFRIRSSEHVAHEINYLIQKYGVLNFKFDDDLFTIQPERIKKIFSLTPQIVYRCFARADTLTEEMCIILKNTGCKHISVGVESGSATILKKMNKGETKEEIRNGLINAKNAGLQIRIYLIVGFPGETDDTINETIDFIQEIPFDEFVVYPLIPYPGTRLVKEMEKFGITAVNTDYDKYIQVGKERFSGFLIRTKTFDEKKVESWRKKLIDLLETKLDKSWSSSKSSYV